MKCPSCGALFASPVPRCPECKFSLQKADARFGLVPAHSRFLTDRTGRLTPAEVQTLRDALKLFQKRFPQTLFSVLLVELPAGSSVAEFAFWIANRARFTSADRLRAENRNILLAVDLAGGSAALTTGYGLEKFVPEATLQRALDQLAGALATNGVAAGVQAAIGSLTEQFRVLAADHPTADARSNERGVDSW